MGKYYLKRRQFPPHDGAPEKATTASGQDAALRPDDPHFDPGAGHLVSAGVVFPSITPQTVGWGRTMVNVGQ